MDEFDRHRYDIIFKSIPYLVDNISLPEKTREEIANCVNKKLSQCKIVIKAPKNTEIVDRSKQHLLIDPNVNKNVSSEFSFRMGALWMKTWIKKNNRI